ncbi:MAG: hypothetical protein N2746_01405 [Deltaproteobacteria bacterium]|nr:hypothetical protein [Deltaproteobacteria bacterium]
MGFVKRERKGIYQKSQIFVYVMFRLFGDKAGRIYTKELKSEFNIKDHTIKGYYQDLKNFISYKSNERFILKRARDEDNNEYWFIEKKNKRSTLDEIIPDNDAIYGENQRAIDNIENILRLYFYKRFFENFRIKSIRTDVDKEYENFINSLKYKKEVENFIRNIDKIFYFFWYAPKTERYNENILQNIVKGILFKKILSIKYCGLEYNKPCETMVKPLSIIYYGGLLYLWGLGATRRHRGIRTFGTDRLDNVFFYLAKCTFAVSGGMGSALPKAGPTQKTIPTIVRSPPVPSRIKSPVGPNIKESNAKSIAPKGIKSAMPNAKLSVPIIKLAILPGYTLYASSPPDTVRSNFFATVRLSPILRLYTPGSSLSLHGVSHNLCTC